MDQAQGIRPAPDVSRAVSGQEQILPIHHGRTGSGDEAGAQIGHGQAGSVNGRLRRMVEISQGDLG